MEKEKLWTKQFMIVSLINFLVVLMFYLLMVTIASYAKIEYNASTSTAGLVSSIFIIGSLIGRLFSGRLIVSLGSKKILWIGIISFLGTSCLYFIHIGIGFLMITRLLQGIAVGIVGTASGTVIAQIVPQSRKGEGIGYYSLSAILATAIGPLIGIWLLKLDSGFTWMFALNVIVSVISIVIIIISKLEVPVIKLTKGTSHGSTSFVSKFLEMRAVPISFVALLVGFSYSGVMSFLSFYAEDINLVEASGYFFLVYALIVIFSRPITGKIFDARGANIIVYPCLVLFALGMILFSQATVGWVLLVSAVLIGVGYGNFNSVAQAVAVKVTPSHRVGLATSTYFILYDLGLGLGPYILGFIVPSSGYRTIFLSMAVLIVICIPIYYILHGRKDKFLLR